MMAILLLILLMMMLCTACLGHFDDLDVCTPDQFGVGSWVWDDDAAPRYVSSDEFQYILHGITAAGFQYHNNCSTTNKERSGDWIWRPKGCKLIPFNKNAFCRTLGGHGLLLIGDSTSRQMFQSLQLMLSSETDCVKHAGECRTTICQKQGYKLESEMHYVSCAKLNSSDYLSCRENWKDRFKYFGTVIVSAGAHPQTIPQFQENALRMVKEIQTVMLQQHQPYHRVIWRTSNWGVSAPIFSTAFEPTVAPMAPEDLYNWTNIPITNAIGSEIFSRAGFPVLDIVPMTSRRPDQRADELHFCLPGPVDTWVNLLFNQLLYLDDTIGPIPKLTHPVPAEWKPSYSGWRRFYDQERSYCDAPKPNATQWSLGDVQFHSKFQVVLTSIKKKIQVSYGLGDVILEDGDVFHLFMNDTLMQTVKPEQDGYFISIIDIPEYTSSFNVLLWSTSHQLPLLHRSLCLDRKTYKESEVCQSNAEFESTPENSVNMHPTIALSTLLGTSFMIEYHLPPIPLEEGDFLKISWDSKPDVIITDPKHQGAYTMLSLEEYIATKNKMSTMEEDHDAIGEFILVLRRKDYELLAWGCGLIAAHLG